MMHESIATLAATWVAGKRVGRLQRQLSVGMAAWWGPRYLFARASAPGHSSGDAPRLARFRDSDALLTIASVC